jgi:hypothetical protein
MMNLEMKPKRSPHIKWRRDVDSVVLYNPQKREMNNLNVVGALIWELCDGGSTLREIAHIVSEEFGEDEDIVLRDIQEFLEKLSDYGHVITEET